MTSLLRILRLFALVAWIGGLVFFIAAVTRVAFHDLPDAHLAGIVVRGTLRVLHHMAFIAGFLYLAATLTLIATQRDSHFARATEVLLVLIMLSLTAYAHFSVMPRMESDRLSLGGDTTTAPSSAPARVHFERLHRVSEKVEGAVLTGGLLLLCLAPFPERNSHERSYL